jgi:hypothetical protein
MKHVSKYLLTICLVSLPAAALADVYPLNPPADLFIDQISVSGTSVTGVVESITDVGNCAALPCFAALNFYADASGFTVENSLDQVLLAGTLIQYATAAGGEVGALFSVTTDNSTLWDALEGGQTATSFGSEVVLDAHDLDLSSIGTQSDATADLTPSAIPEPASMTLLLSGLAAGFVRKRMAKKRNIQSIA